jgi:AAA+ superfamily predicted ATPase
VTTALDKDILSLQHLQAELRRIDILIRREVFRWQLAGQDPADDFRGLYLSDDQAKALLARPLGTSWGQTVTLPPAEAQAFAEAQAQAAEQAEALAEKARQSGTPSRLDHLATIFGLDRFDLDTILICLAPSLDLRYERLYGYLQDNITRKHPSVDLILNLLCEPGPERLKMLPRFAESHPLFRHEILQFEAGERETDTPSLLGRALRLDPSIAAWLLGDYCPCTDLRPHTQLLQPQANNSENTDENERLLASDVWPNLKQAVDGMKPKTVIVLHGPDEEIRRATVQLLANHMSQSLLEVNLASVKAAGQSPHHTLTLAMRDARIIQAIPHLTGWDACLAKGAPPTELLNMLCTHSHPVIISGKKAWRAGGIDRERTFLWVKCPMPRHQQRQGLWVNFLKSVTGQPSPELEIDVTGLAGQFTLTSGQIRDAVATARDMAARRGDSIQTEDLFTAARVHSNPRLSSLARKITPRYTWDDIVLPEDQLALLHEIVATVRGRPKVLEEWGVGEKLAASDGITMLFAGPPGTGKTMAAEVIASALRLDLYKIDLSTIVSKYIGETEKNLEQIFNEAQNSNAILFFDEADALFGKRSEVRDSHDRYANIEISYLLQRMETYDGVTILATNLRANLDEAFTRRLQFAVDFPFPEEEYRLRIWRTLFPPDAPRTPDLEFGLLARRFKIAGGNIRNIIVNAAFLAAADDGPIKMAHLIHSTRRELQKMGRLVDEADMDYVKRRP